MRFSNRLALIALCAPWACMAQSVAASAPAPAASAAHADASLQHKVIEDEAVRIEETRLRGAATRITVHSKLPGVKDYQIQVAPAGRDASEPRGGAGQRAWTLLSF